MSQPGGPFDLGSEDFSLQRGSSISYSRVPSSISSPASVDHSPNHLSPDDISFLQDGEVRAMFRKVIVNEAFLNQTIEKLGGGDKGMKALIGYIKLWVMRTRNIGSSVSKCEEELDTIQQPASAQACSAVPDHDVYPHGHQKTIMRLEYENDRSDDNTSGLKRAFPFEPIDHSAESNYFSQESKVCRLYGGAFSNMEINTGFSTREPVSPVTSEELTANLPNVSTSGMNLMNSPHGRFIYNNMMNQLRPSPPPTGSGFGLDADNDSNLSPAAGNSAAYKNRLAQRHQSLVSPNMWKTDSLHLLFQKDLQPSDVGSLGRIILPQESEAHLPYLTPKEGVLVSMDDFDTGMAWSFQYRHWPNSRSRMYLLENTGEFVKTHDLEGGDLLIIYKNPLGNFVIRGKKNDCFETFVPTGVHLAYDMATWVPSMAKPVKVEETCDRRFLLNVPDEGCGMVEPFDTFLQDMMQGIHDEYEQCVGKGLRQLEWFASLDPEFSVDDTLQFMSVEGAV